MFRSSCSVNPGGLFGVPCRSIKSLSHHPPTLMALFKPLSLRRNYGADDVVEEASELGDAEAEASALLPSVPSALPPEADQAAAKPRPLVDRASQQRVINAQFPFLAVSHLTGMPPLVVPVETFNSHPAITSIDMVLSPDVGR